jgi:hypothetical protein
MLADVGNLVQRINGARIDGAGAVLCPRSGGLHFADPHG